MADQGKATWRFSVHFWSANVAELFERAAYYGVFIGLVVYLTRNFGFSDAESGWIAGLFYALLYLVPPFAGAWADRVGFRRALATAFALLALGYALLGTFGSVVGEDVRAQYLAARSAESLFGDAGRAAALELLGGAAWRWSAVIGLVVIMLGGAIVKPVVTGTVARNSNEATRARAFSIFYQIVNIGAFLGKTFAPTLREELGLEYVSFYSSVMGLLGMVVVLLFFRPPASEGEGKSFRQILRGFGVVLRNWRFMALILIVAGFWTIQGQLYSAMPKYVLRMVGEHARPEWLANINPLVVVIFVIPITHLVRKLRPVTSIGIGLMIIPVTAFVIALSPSLAAAAGPEVGIFGAVFHPITVTLILGIGLQGLAECFLSPRFLEYASKQAPKGEEGLYMGYSHIHTVFSGILGFVLAGYLLEAYCPDPKTLPLAVHNQWKVALETGGELPAAYAHAHQLWFVFAAIGVLSFVMLLLYRHLTDRADRRAGIDPNGEEAKG